MKQSLSSRLAALCAAFVISAVVLESVAELGHPAPGANVVNTVASAMSAASTVANSKTL